MLPAQKADTLNCGHDPESIGPSARGVPFYKEPDPAKCRALFDAFLQRHGEAARDGILQQLYDDLDALEASEQKRRFPPVTEFADQPRKLLIHLYGKPKDVKSADRPRVKALSDGDRARVIGEGLIYDHSEKIDRAVRDLLRSAGDDDYLAQACVQRLIGRGYDADIEAYCRRRLKEVTDPRDRADLEGDLERLGWTMLHVAVSNNDQDGLRALLRGGAKVDAPARNGRTPLHLAAAAGNADVVRQLVEAGASLDVRDRAGQTPVQLAARADASDVVQFLVARGCEVPDVLVAAIVGRADLVPGLLRKEPAAVRSATRSGQTPLHLAARFGHAGVAKALLAQGADVRKADQEGLTPMHAAAAAGSEAVIGELIRAGAAVRAVVGTTGVEPLHLAAEQGTPGRRRSCWTGRRPPKPA